MSVVRAISGAMTFLAYLFILTGLLFFLNNAGFVTIEWNIVWPLILIAIGASLLHAIYRIRHGFETLIWKIIKRF